MNSPPEKCECGGKERSPRTHNGTVAYFRCGRRCILVGDEWEMELPTLHCFSRQVTKAKLEIERLKAGYLWLERLAEQQAITIRVARDGEIEISEADGIHALHVHTDLKDLCTREAAEAKGE